MSLLFVYTGLPKIEDGANCYPIRVNMNFVFNSELDLQNRNCMNVISLIL